MQISLLVLCIVHRVMMSVLSGESENKKGTPQLTSAKSPNVTSEIASVDVPKISLSYSEETVKKNSFADEIDTAYLIQQR